MAKRYINLNKTNMKTIEEQIESQIKKLKSQLTGNLFADGEIQQEIYELKKILNPRIAENPEEDTDEGCINCSG
jgi:hypothetical protein